MAKRSLAVFENARELRLSAWVQTLRTLGMMERRITAYVTGKGLTLPQFDLLATLRFSEGVTQQELAERLLVTKGNITGLVNRLQEAGWVERRPDAQDARANRLYLTAAGKRKIEAVLPGHDELVASILGQFSDAEIKTLRASMSAIEDAVER